MSWRFELIRMMERNEGVIFADDLITVLVDGYPKGKKHFLVMSNKDISGIKHVKKEHLELLQAMDAKGRELAAAEEDMEFRIGYHALPSMERLHLHVVSDDFISPCLKHLKHWNSFTTKFFIDSRKAINDLQKEGHVVLPTEQECNAYLTTKLKCHKCNYIPKNMPSLKKHLPTHEPDKPAH